MTATQEPPRPVITAVVQIGNSDDKLTQAEWSVFVQQTQLLIGLWAKQIHFEGFSIPQQVWQNACWVVEISEGNVALFRSTLASLARRFRQDSIALTLGETEFVMPAGPS